MPRPPCCRRVSGSPAYVLFAPVGGVPNRHEQLAMTLDELEAIRLADLEGLYQEQAAERMGVSRATFGRIVMSARRKVAETLVAGKALRIEGGVIAHDPNPPPRCRACHHECQGVSEGENDCARCGCRAHADGGRRASHRGGREGCPCAREDCPGARCKEKQQ